MPSSSTERYRLTVSIVEWPRESLMVSVPMPADNNLVANVLLKIWKECFSPLKTLSMAAVQAEQSACPEMQRRFQSTIYKAKKR